MKSKYDKGKLVVVTDQQGKIIGAAMPKDEKDHQVGMEPLDGQIMHVVNLPKKVSALITPENLHAVLRDARVTANGDLKVREFKSQK